MVTAKQKQLSTQEECLARELSETMGAPGDTGAACFDLSALVTDEYEGVVF